MSPNSRLALLTSHLERSSNNSSSNNNNNNNKMATQTVRASVLHGAKDLRVVSPPISNNKKTTTTT